MFIDNQYLTLNKRDIDSTHTVIESEFSCVDGGIEAKWPSLFPPARLWMLRRFLLLLMLPVCGLVAASCAHTAGALAGAEASQMASLAATQAAAASTQAIAALETAATQMSQQVQTGQIPSLPDTNGKLLVIDTPTATLVRVHGQTIIVKKSTPLQDDGSAENP
jgi:uncharacterized protein (UPF0333 family)